MSAYITLMTPMMDQESLLAALEDMGFHAAKIEVHATPVSLVGYQNDQRKQTAHIIIRRQHVGSGSNDIGFLSTNTGFRAHISDYDQRQFGQDWLSKLNTRYQSRFSAKQARIEAEERRVLEEQKKQLIEAQRKTIYEKAKKMGYRVRESQEGDKIRLVLVKRVYG